MSSAFRLEWEVRPTVRRRKRPAKVRLAYRTGRGSMYRGTAEDFFKSSIASRYLGKVQLIFTSPPFPLNHKKKYGNKTGDEYVAWLASFAPLFRKLLKRNGSIAIELGNAWEPGRPVMSPLSLRALLAFLEAGRFQLCQQFICHNPARLPTPAQWVTVDRIRVKDSYTHVWWMAPSDRPKANNRRVLTEYSESMRRLLAAGSYNLGPRPSGHHIGRDSFLRDNAGAIPSNVLTFGNTVSSDAYLRFCRERDLPVHPARMAVGLPSFFIKFLTERRDLVLDPFAGSNTTGAAAEQLGRRWAAIEPTFTYVRGSRGRFANTRKRARK